MFRFFEFFLVLVQLSIVACDVELRIFKNISNRYEPIDFLVEEWPGLDFSLICNLQYNAQRYDVHDDEMGWGRSSPDFSFRNESDLMQIMNKSTDSFLAYLGSNHIIKQGRNNEVVWNFNIFSSKDEGTYLCFSWKYKLFKFIDVIIKRDALVMNSITDCTEKMFKCQTNGPCIKKHFVCDGRKDCRDGSDENFENCGATPCKDKLPCNNGRCIPVDWCCDVHLDVNCSTTYRPPCCQKLSDGYDDMDDDLHDIKSYVQQGGTRYLFISLCILATFFSIVLMLLILSKLFLYAKKTRYTNGNLFHLSDLQEYPSRGRRQRSTTDNYRVYPPIISNTIIIDSGSELPLLNNSNLLPNSLNLRLNSTLYSDQPPSYTEVVGNLTSGHISDPPPPYTSREVLNVPDERSVN